MAEKKKKSARTEEAQRTRLLILAGLVLAGLVFMFFTNGSLSARQESLATLTTKQKQRDEAVAELRKYQDDPALVQQIVQQLAEVEGAIPYYGSKDPTADLQLKLPAALATALTEAGIEFDTLTPPSIKSGEDMPRNVGALETALQFEASFAQLNSTLENLQEQGYFVTLLSCTFKSTTEDPDVPPVLDPDGKVRMEVTLRFWYSSEPPFGAETGATSGAGDTPSADPATTVPAPASTGAPTTTATSAAPASTMTATTRPSGRAPALAPTTTAAA